MGMNIVYILCIHKYTTVYSILYTVYCIQYTLYYCILLYTLHYLSVYLTTEWDNSVDYSISRSSTLAAGFTDPGHPSSTAWRPTGERDQMSHHYQHHINIIF